MNDLAGRRLGLRGRVDNEVSGTLSGREGAGVTKVVVGFDLGATARFNVSVEVVGEVDGVLKVAERPTSVNLGLAVVSVGSVGPFSSNSSSAPMSCCAFFKASSDTAIDRPAAVWKPKNGGTLSLKLRALFLTMDTLGGWSSEGTSMVDGHSSGSLCSGICSPSAITDPFLVFLKPGALTDMDGFSEDNSPLFPLSVSFTSSHCF